MNGTTKYDRWLEAALKTLSDDFCEGRFHPLNESDIKNHLYSALLRTKDVVGGFTHQHSVSTEFAVNLQERIDVAIIKTAKMGGQPRLFLEIKETSQDSLPLEEIRKRVDADVAKMLTCLPQPRTRVVFFFFRGAHQHKHAADKIVGCDSKSEGISVRTNEMMAQLKEELSKRGVVLKWGPC